MIDITLRLETPDDYREVENLTREAFWNVYAPGCVEHYMLHRMRQSLDFIPELDIVAVCNGQIVGHVVCVNSYIEGDDNKRHEVLSLGPISVFPACQRKGIGRKMIEHIISTAGRLGYSAILLCGDPLLYARYGFDAAGKYGIRTSCNKIFPALQVYPLNNTDMTKYAGRYVENSIYEIDRMQADIFDNGFPVKEKISDTPMQLRLKEILMMQEDFCQDRGNTGRV